MGKRVLKELLVFNDGCVAAFGDDGLAIPLEVKNVVQELIKNAVEQGFVADQVRVSWPCKAYMYVNREVNDVAK